MGAGQGRVRLQFEGWIWFHAVCGAVVVSTSGILSTRALTNIRKPNEQNPLHRKHREPNPPLSRTRSNPSSRPEPHSHHPSPTRSSLGWKVAGSFPTSLEDSPSWIDATNGIRYRRRGWSKWIGRGCISIDGKFTAVSTSTARSPTRGSSLPRRNRRYAPQRIIVPNNKWGKPGCRSLPNAQARVRALSKSKEFACGFGTQSPGALAFSDVALQVHDGYEWCGYRSRELTCRPMSLSTQISPPFSW